MFQEIDYELFMQILFDKDTQEQFLKECKELGIIEEDEEEDN